MGKGLGNKVSSEKRRMKKHMQKNLGFETFSQRIKRKLKTKKECSRCGKDLTEQDLSFVRPSKSKLCTACFTSNA